MHIEPFQKRLKILLTIFPALATAEVLFMILNLRITNIMRNVNLDSVEHGEIRPNEKRCLSG